MCADALEPCTAVRRTAEEVRRNESARRSTSEQCLNRRAARCAASRRNDLVEWCAGWHFNDARVRDRSTDLHEHRSRLCGVADLRVGRCAVVQDPWHRGECGDIVHGGWLAEIPDLRWIWRCLLWLAALAGERLHQHRLFADHAGALEWSHGNDQFATGAEQRCTKDSLAFGVGDHRFKALDRFGVLGAHGDERFAGAHGKGGDGEPFNDRLWVLLHKEAVGEDGGVRLVAIRHGVVLAGWLGGSRLPLRSRKEAATPTTAEAGVDQGCGCSGRARGRGGAERRPRLGRRYEEELAPALRGVQALHAAYLPARAAAQLAAFLALKSRCGSPSMTTSGDGAPSRWLGSDSRRRLLHGIARPNSVPNS